MIAAGVCATSLSLGSHVASGADSYGYVSQARLWFQGSLIQPEPLARLAAWPNAAATLAPLGTVRRRARSATSRPMPRGCRF